MADLSEASRRREIRRRKILDNSEDRLNRLLGHGGGNRDGLSSSQFSTTADSEDLKSMPENTTETTHRSNSLTEESDGGHEFRFHQNSAAHMHECHTPTGADGADEDKASILTNLGSSGMVLQAPRNIDLPSCGSTLPQGTKISRREFPAFRTYLKANTDTDKNDCTNKFTETRSVNQSSPVSNNSFDGKNSPVKTGSTWSLDFVRRVLYIFTAVLWRLLLLGGLVAPNAKSIIYPFLVLELAVMSYDVLYVEQKQGTLVLLVNLFCSLLMSNVPTSIIDSVGKYCTVVSKVVEDLALYLFTFFICHWCIEQLISVY